MLSALRLKLTLLGMLTLLATSPASAALIDNGTSMIDDGTGLEWLDLSETIGVTVASALATVNALPANAGNPYSVATDAQVLQLFTNAGFTIPLVSGQLVADQPAALNLLNILGCTSACGGVNAFARGFAEKAATPGSYFRPSYSRSTTGGDAIVASLSNNGLTAYAGNATFLVRGVVPEPGTALLLGLGLIGLTAHGRRHR